MTTTSPAATTGGARVRVQRFGTFLSGMIMPNIAAFIAWGIITALFIDKGWVGNDGPIEAWRWANSAILGGGTIGDVDYKGLVGPIINYLLPLLIAFTGGRMVHGHRGGVVGAVAAFGVIIGADGTVMFLGAMIAGPLTALILKWVEKPWQGKIKPGFEMLVDNFSAGFVAFFASLAAFFWLAPLMKWVTDVLGGAVGWLVETHLLPLASIIVEPAKVLFLNNAINHGVFTPLGSEQSSQTGKSLLFLIEANPGPGLGLLMAITVFGVGAARATAPGAAIIQFLGGIHEVYFPYVLAKPALIIGLIAGGATGVLTNVIFQSGLVAPAAPGSIFAVLFQIAPGSHLGVLLSVILAAAVTFVVCMPILLASRRRDLAAEGGDAAFTAAIAQTEANKGKKSSVLGTLGGAGTATLTRHVESIVFACDAGMGSSAMGASVLRNKIKQAGITGVTVVNQAIANLDGTADLVITQQQLTDRARAKSPDSMHVSVDNFMNSPKYDEVVELVRSQQTEEAGDQPATAPEAQAAPAASGILTPDRVRIHSGSATRDEALKEAADALVAAGAVTPDYLQAMQDREQTVSTFMGNGLAIPHGTNDAKDAVLGSALSVVRYDGGVDWDGDRATFVIGIAGKDGDHLQILSQIAELFSDENDVARLNAAATPEELFQLLSAVNEA
ncbi:PTS mannitol transporter subunit IICBA [Microbacterium sp. ARD32]|uniref:PTS mannitol transporter subunit IICBA n=1 Tax=Microbacterium sp. ARD32 TaxID=2962577 RepID=UPI002882342E|nr:PTS mannitol transporter subunit IICBA [Microbacterium sp. ARD32]MDT0158666.1 PTS mannitol transporter subunit IICBA [Microbacterium sp. ARD32]